MIKEYIKKIKIFSQFLRRRQIDNWVKSRYVLPPYHAVKEMTILFFALKNRLGTFVETGTYMGDMDWALKDTFSQIYSIELSKELYAKAKRRFSRYQHIQILHGDSAILLKEVVSKLESPALFWLDGHYSGGETARGKLICPIYGELSHIFNSELKHTVLIDDARLFNGEDDYPKMEDLLEYLYKNGRSGYVVNDIIVVD